MSAPSRPKLVAYLSGHGYGHATRSAAVLEEVARHAEIHLRTSGRALALGRAASWPATVTEVDVGPGVAQRGPLRVDLPATRTALAEHLTAWPRRVEEEAAAIRASGASLVFADVPPIAFAAAARAGVPSVGLGNFSWSWIYDGYAASDPWFAGAARALAEAEAQATRFLALAMGGGLEVFPRRWELPPVARRPTRGRAEARRMLPFACDAKGGDPRPIVLVSFGGFGGDLDLAAAGRQDDLRLLVVAAAIPERSPPSESVSNNLRSVLPTDELPHQDLVLAADCVIGKPGYGTVAECLAAGTPMVWVPRGEFREQPSLVAAIERFLPHAALSIEDLEKGRWSPAVREALASTPAERLPPSDGAADAAALVLEWLDGSRAAPHEDQR